MSSGQYAQHLYPAPGTVDRWVLDGTVPPGWECRAGDVTLLMDNDSGQIIPIPDTFGMVQRHRVRTWVLAHFFFYLDPTIVGIVSFTEQHQPHQSSSNPNRSRAPLILPATLLPNASTSVAIVGITSL